MKKEMKKAFFILLVLSLSLSFSVVMAEEHREFKIVKPEAGTLGDGFSGIWEGSWPSRKPSGRTQIEYGISTTLAIEEVSPPKIKGLYLVSGSPPQEIQGEIKDPKTVLIVLNTGAKLVLNLTSDKTIKAEFRSLRPGPPNECTLFKK